MATYGQPQMMQAQFNALHAYSKELRDLMTVIVVDDHGSPEFFNRVCDQLNSRAFRIGDDIAWNQMGARNLAIEKADTEWLLLIDPDMIFEEEVLWRLLETKVPHKAIVRPKLRHKSTGELDGNSPNIYWCRKSTMLEVGCYDEDFRGHKGWSDVSLMHVLKMAGYKDIVRDDLWAWFYGPGDIPDAMVQSLNRDVATNKKEHLRKMKMMRAMGIRRFIEWRRKQERCRFRYREV